MPAAEATPVTADALPRSGRALDALNFFLADVHGGLGPYLAVYLLTVRQWHEGQIGIAMSIAGIAGVIAQTPVGALVDATRAKRALIAAAALLTAIASMVLMASPSFIPVATTQSVVGMAGAVFGPAVAAISLGIVGQRLLAHRVSRNEAFNHAGNATAAMLAGIGAYLWGPTAVFVLLALMAVATIVSALCIPPDAIDYDAARGLEDGNRADRDPSSSWQPSGWRVLLTCRPLLIFAACVVLFHLANAAMLPLVGQKLALADRNQGTALMSGCIVAAQCVMVPMAILVGRKANYWGRKGLFLSGFAVLTLRGVLYTVSDDRWWLLSVQTLDGVGAGLFGALFPLIVADLTRGTGRFNISQGAIGTAQGIGAALSTAVAEGIVTLAGYSAAFLSLAGIATAGFALFSIAMPETRPSDETE